MAKPIPVTLQMVMSDREIELVERLAELLGRTKSDIFVECARRAIEKECVSTTA